MKAAWYEANGGPEVFRYGDLPDPVPQPDQVLIRVERVSIEGGDVVNRRRGPLLSPRHVVGYQAAGEIVAVGADVAGLAVGQRVVAHNAAGSHAELLAAPAAFAFPIPDGVDIDVASTVPVTFGTAHDALFEFGGLKAGETVLIQGAAGGVGIACVQLAKRAGARVIGTASDPARLERLKALGLDHGIDYRTEDVGERTRAFTDGRGADLVVDMAGGATLKPLFDAMAYRGRLALVGVSSGAFPSISFGELMAKNLSVIGVFLALELHTPRVRAVIAAIMDDIRAGRLTMPVEAVYPLSDVARAHAHVESGHPFGRVLMRP